MDLGLTTSGTVSAGLSPAHNSYPLISNLPTNSFCNIHTRSKCRRVPASEEAPPYSCHSPPECHFVGRSCTLNCFPCCSSLIFHDLFFMLVFCRLSLPDGSFYEGEWADGLRDGRGTLVLSSGDQLTGPWRKGLIAGPVDYSLSHHSPWTNAEL